MCLFDPDTSMVFLAGKVGSEQTVLCTEYIYIYTWLAWFCLSTCQSVCLYVCLMSVQTLTWHGRRRPLKARSCNSLPPEYSSMHIGIQGVLVAEVTSNSSISSMDHQGV